MISAAAILIIGLVVFSKVLTKSSRQPITLVSEQERRRGPCPGKTQEIKTPDGKTNSMLPNYYACHEVDRGDLVYYRFSDQFDPVVRKVYGIPGDTFELVEDKKREVWHIKINRELVLNQDQTPRSFGGKSRPVLKLYEDSLKGRLPKQNFIIFSEDPNSGRDSSSFGVVNSDDFIGKIE